MAAYRSHCSWICIGKNTKELQGWLCHSFGVGIIVCRKHEEKMNSKEPSSKYWKGWYVIVFAFLIVQIIFFYWLTQYFN